MDSIKEPDKEWIGEWHDWNKCKEQWAEVTHAIKAMWFELNFVTQQELTILNFEWNVMKPKWCEELGIYLIR